MRVVCVVCVSYCNTNTWEFVDVAAIVILDVPHIGGGSSVHQGELAKLGKIQTVVPHCIVDLVCVDFLDTSGTECCFERVLCTHTHTHTHTIPSIT
jgi:hypothetical protein